MGSLGWTWGGVWHSQKAPHSWSYRDLEGATTCGLASLGGGLTKKEALSFLPFLFSKQVQKPPVRGLRDRRTRTEAETSVKLDGRQHLKTDGTRGGTGGRSAGQAEQTQSWAII